MRKLRDVLRLTAGGMSSRQVAASLTIGATTVIDYLARARRAGIAWPLPDELTDEALEASLYPPPPIVAKDQRPLPDWRSPPHPRLPTPCQVRHPHRRTHLGWWRSERRRTARQVLPQQPGSC